MMTSKIAKAFSDDNRIKILKFLGEGERNVAQVADRLDLEENLASHHLRVLAYLGFLKADRRGRKVFYRINETKFISLVKDLMNSPVFKTVLSRSRN